jgi:hypothetical protein
MNYAGLLGIQHGAASLLVGAFGKREKHTFLDLMFPNSGIFQVPQKWCSVKF